MRSFLLLVALLIAPALPSAQGGVPDGDADEAKPVKAAAAVEAAGMRGMRIDRGADQLPLWVPEAENLEFEVILNVAVIGATKVGDFDLAAGLEPYVAGLPLPGESADTGLQTGWIRGSAGGRYLTYTLEHMIEARMLPEGWPRVIYRSEQGGSENRRSEIRFGVQDGESSLWYRKDHHCKECTRPEHKIVGRWPFGGEKHCKKCKRGEHRVWKEPVTRDVPHGAVDMLSAIYLSRTMVRLGRDEVTFPLLDKTKVWDLTLTRGGKKEIETKAGTYLCRKIEMSTSVPDGEEHKDEEFKGLFGIHGVIKIWLEETTGVPVMIEGFVPLGPFDLDVKLKLKGFEGTPEDFVEVEEKDE